MGVFQFFELYKCCRLGTKWYQIDFILPIFTLFGTNNDVAIHCNDVCTAFVDQTNYYNLWNST